MVRAVLDLTGCKTRRDMHERFKVALHFPDYYGENWDAFYDSLSGYSDVNFIEIRGEHTLSSEFADSLQMLHRILEDVKLHFKKYAEEFDYIIVD